MWWHGLICWHGSHVPTQPHGIVHTPAHNCAMSHGCQEEAHAYLFDCLPCFHVGTGCEHACFNICSVPAQPGDGVDTPVYMCAVFHYHHPAAGGKGLTALYIPAIYQHCHMEV